MRGHGRFISGKTVALAIIVTILFSMVQVAPALAAVWTNVSTSLQSSYFECLAYDSTRDVLYASLDWQGVWRCDHPYTSPVWTDIRGELASFRVKSLAFDMVRNILYAGAMTSSELSDQGHGVWRCTNPNTTPVWTNTGGGLSSTLVEALACDTTRDILYAGIPGPGQSGNAVWRCTSPEGTASWVNIGAGLTVPGAFRLCVDTARDVLYAAAYDNTTWRCTSPDSTALWANITSGSENHSVQSFALDATRNILYAGECRGGVWRCASPDTSSAWESLGGVPLSWLEIPSLAYDPARNRLYAATYWEDPYLAKGEGRGIWQCSSPDSTPSWSDTGGDAGKYQVIDLVCDSAHDVLYAASGQNGLWSSTVPTEQRDFSTTVTSNRPIVVERPMYFDYKGRRGGSDVVGATSEASVFYFAEGTCRPDFDPYITIENPGTAAAAVTLTYLKGDGGTPSSNFTVPPESRATVHPSDTLGVGDDTSHDFSTIVRCTNGQGIVAERPMYFSYGGAWNGGSDAVGATALSKQWYFAEGTTLEGFDEFVTVLNPGSGSARLTFRYMVEKEGEKTVTDAVAPHSRATFKTVEQIGMNKNASLMLTSDQEVVAERPMYFNYHGMWTGGHDVVGANAPRSDWYFAEGTTRSDPESGSFEEWLCLQNPTESAIVVNATYQLAAGQGGPVKKTYRIPAKQRLTLSVNSELGPGKDASVALSSSAMFVAERPMYFNYHGKWTGGHDVMGADDPATTFFFAEGTCRPNFEPYFCIQNTGDEVAEVTLRYLGSSGWTMEQDVRVPPRSRETIDPIRMFGLP